jgi:hypothetical protein
MLEEGKLEIWEGKVLTVPNFHYKCCGKPPDLNAGGCYTAYFENKCGEQIVFQYDFMSKKGTLWHGDYGWDTPVPVMGGGTTMIMGKEEREWLHLVWQVATRTETREFQLRSSLDLVNAYKDIYDELLARPEFAGKDMQYSFLKTKRKLERQAKALSDELIGAQAGDATEGGEDERR